MTITDTDRVEWLEREANKPGGLLLHDGSEGGRRGLGLRPGSLVRSLREAIDCCIRAERGIDPPRRLVDVAYLSVSSPTPQQGADK